MATTGKLYRITKPIPYKFNETKKKKKPQTTKY